MLARVGEQTGAIGKPHTLFGKAVQIGRFVKGAAVTAQLVPAQVIGQDKDNIGLPAGRIRAKYRGKVAQPGKLSFLLSTRLIFGFC
jgi:hypothetical protein